MTRRIYMSLARAVQANERLLLHALLWVSIGGFVALVIAVVLLGATGTPVEFFGRVWFSLCGGFTVALAAGNRFNPYRTTEPTSTEESCSVFLLNALLIIAVVPWFW